MLFRKMLRDMRLHKTQFISIFLMSFLGVFIYSGIGGEWVGLRKIVDNYYEETNFGDLWVYGNGFTNEEKEEISKIEGVTGVERRLTLEGTGELSSNPTITLHFLEEGNISKGYLVQGVEFDKNKDGLWLDDLFAKANNLKVGEYINIKTNGISIEKKILGTILSPEYVYSSNGKELVPNHNNYGFAYLSKEGFPKNLDIFYTDLVITTDNSNYDEFENKISDALNGHYSIFLNRDNNPSAQMFYQETEQHKAFGTVFPIVFLAIALLTILTTMTRMVNNQRVQIGTLKALGFKKKKILFHYISYGFWLSLIGSLLGGVIGPITLPYLFYDSMKTTYTLPEWKPSLSIRFIIMAILCVAICTLVTYLACRNNLKDTPSESLRPKAPKAIKVSFFEKSKLWNKLGFNVQWNFRDLVRSKIRSVMAIVGVLGCTTLLVCAFGMQDSLDDVVKWQYSEINAFNSKLILDENVTKEDISFIKEELLGQGIREGTVEIKGKDRNKTGMILVKDNATLIRETNENREFINLPKDGIALSYKMANLLDVKKGEEVKWHLYGEEDWKTSKVYEIYRDPTSQGITLSRDVYEKLGYTFTPTSFITSKDVKEAPMGVSKVWTKDELTSSYEEMSEAMNIMVYVLILGATLLAVVVLYNLGVLSFTERERELATLKVIGFKSKKIRRLLLTQNIWLTSIGIIIGIPIGKWLINYIISFLGDSLDMMTVVSISTIIISIVITFSLSIIVNLMFSRKVKKIDMVSSLKGVE